MADPVVNIIFKATDQTKGIFGKLTGSLGGLAKVAVGAAIGGFAALSYATAKSISAASDLNETYNKVDVVFGDASTAIKAFAANSATALGQTTQQALDAASTFGVFGKAAGLTDKPLADFSTSLTSLASDLASFYNADPSEVIMALGAGLRGESEPMRRFGVLLDDATLRQKALAMGIVDTTKNALTPQQRVLAAQAVIMEQSAIAQGDFARTSDGLANSQRILTAELGNLSTTWGQIFLPIAQTVVSFLAHDVLPPFANLIKALQDAGLFSSEFTEALGAIVGDEAAVQIVAFLQNLYQWMRINLPIALAFLANVWQTVLLQAITAVWQWMSTVLIPFIQNVVFPWLQANLPKAIQFLSDFFRNVLIPAVQAVWTFIGNFLTTVTQWWTAHSDQIQAIARALWDFLVGAVRQFIESFSNVIQLFHLAQQGKWYEFGEKLRSILDEAWKRIKQAASEAFQAIKDFFIQTDWGAVGTGILQGIAKGITTGLKIIKDAAVAAAKAALEAAKGFLGIKSPSKVFMEIGGNMMAGMALGINQAAGLPALATVNAAAGIIHNTYNTFNLNANYPYQSPGSLAMDIRTLELLYGR